MSVMDYFLRAEVERMRNEECNWSDNRSETREQFNRRLRATARAIPRQLIDKEIGDLARRTELLYRAKGGLDESEEIKGY